MSSTTSIDQAELSKFNKSATEWWDEQGEFKLLHKINPTRIEYIKDKIKHHFAIDIDDEMLLKNISILDVGCGGGIVSVPLAECGAEVTGIDANKSNVKAATEHCKTNNINARFVNITAEELATNKEQFDVVLALEVIEHVQNPREFVQNLCRLTKPDGMIVVSTINRTVKSYIFAIVMAEYILGWVPKRTHDHNKFIKPSELNKMIDGSKFSLKELKGLTIDLPRTRWQTSMDIDVNYFAYIG